MRDHPSLRFDLYCRVIDNHGDLGVCWRLAADLASRGHAVRLFVDDASALAWMAPHGARGVTVHPWPAAEHDRATGSDAGADDDPDAVLEAFGCALPDPVVLGMARAARPPVWLNLEYLSAEPLVDRLHGLPSPQLAGPGRGLPKWFFYPGFSPATGGLLREADLAVRQRRFDPVAWRAAHGIALRPGEACASLFCYPDAPLAALVDAIAAGADGRPTALLAAPGEAARRLGDLMGPAGRGGPVRMIALPWLSQVDYDHLLWSCDLNVVRGEDSFVRAQWAGRPMLWHVYPQHDGVHALKLQAFLDRMLAGAPAPLADAVAAAHLTFNRLDEAPLVLPDWRPDASCVPAQGADAGAAAPGAVPGGPAWNAHAAAWRRTLASLPDLADRLTDFVRRAS